MTHYAGAKSLDAEIILNLLDGSIIMDYSLNRFGHPMDSNRSVAINSTFRKLPKNTRLKIAIKVAILRCLDPWFILVVASVFTTLVNRKIIKNPKYHYNYQNLLKQYQEESQGIFEQSQRGPLDKNIVTFHIEKNIWLEYQLSGDYQDKIKTISLKRHFIHFFKFGKYPEQKQLGWDVIFEFTEPPKEGGCLIRYV